MRLALFATIVVVLLAESPTKPSLGATALAARNITITGEVLRIDNGEAVIKVKDGRIRVAMNRLSKTDKKTVVMASGKKREISLSLSPRSLE